MDYLLFQTPSRNDFSPQDWLDHDAPAPPAGANRQADGTVPERLLRCNKIIVRRVNLHNFEQKALKNRRTRIDPPMRYD
ncbi:hypothetical protein ACNHKD_18750 [Methylocystis sp. JAN1]|uniref:hypothetical protein n=1 Tax=Methylocystis sp. JAN1 TaxID=3397211 RepID=UPI003FA25556